MSQTTSTATKRPRIAGLDFARYWAFLGVVWVNYTVLHFHETGNTGIETLFQGNAAALFVTIAGIGISLLSQEARVSGDEELLKRAKSTLRKRAGFLAVLGLVLLAIGWEADILHYYAAWLFIATFFLTASNRILWLAVAICIIVFYLSLPWYERGWDWQTLTYPDLWTPLGFLHNLFFNGWHPVFPWFVFILVGMRVGRADLSEPKVRRAIGGLALAVFVVFEILSIGGLQIAKHLGADISYGGEVAALLGTASIPPSIFYLATGAGGAIAFLIVCFEIAERFGQTRLVAWCAVTGRHLLTHYTLHALAFLILYMMNGNAMPAYPFLLTAAWTNFIGAMIFSVLWNRRFNQGPLEIAMRRLSR